MKWKLYYVAFLCFILGAGVKSCILESECREYGKIVLNSSRVYTCELKGTK